MSSDDRIRDVERLPVLTTMVLGLIPIASFGTWLYGFGVLLTPIVTDTGWREATLSAAYGVSVLMAGILGVVAGRISERRGVPIVFVVTGLVSVAGSFLMALTVSQWVFSVGVVLVAGVVGAAGYYTLVHSSIARLVPGDRRRAITINTLFGAFASVIFLPAMAWLIESLDWRATVMITGAITGAAFLVGAVIVTDTGMDGETQSPRFWRIIGDSLTHPRLRRLLLAGICGAFAMSVLILYQVPAMVDGGLALATASTLAGARGFLQLGGRLPVPWMGRVLGDPRTMQLALGILAVSLVLLPWSGRIVIAVAFVVTAGFAIGAYTTVENIVGSGLVDPIRVGTFLGMYALVRGLGSSVGPAVSGFITEASGTRTTALLVAAILAVVGVLLVPGESDSPGTQG